jgi:hypothetical protein
MKKIISLLTGIAIGSISIGGVIPASYVLRVETVKEGILLLTNTSNHRIYVKNFVLRNYTVNEFGKRTGKVHEINVSIGSQLNPGQSRLEQTSYPQYQTTANTELLRWNDGKKNHRAGFLICFINDFNHNVYRTPNGQLSCPK